jgi:hypothetical protein
VRVQVVGGGSGRQAAGRQEEGGGRRQEGRRREEAGGRQARDREDLKFELLGIVTHLNAAATGQPPLFSEKLQRISNNILSER